MLIKDKRVLYITYYYPPEIGAGSLRASEITAALSEECKVDVVTNHPNYPNCELYSPNNTVECDLSQAEKGIHVYRLRNISGTTLFIRTLAYLWFVIGCILKSCRLLFFRRYHYLVTTSPPITVLVAGVILSFCTSAKWILEIRDLWPDILSELGKLPTQSLRYRLLVKIEKAAYRRGDKVITVTEGFKKYLIEEKGVPADKISVVLNGTDLKESCKWKFTEEELYSVKTSLGIKEDNICGYLGTIGYAQGLEVILQLASRCPDWHFLFCGEGAEKQRLIQMSENLTNVTFLPGNNVKEYLDKLYSVIDVGLVCLRNTPTLNLTIPSKIYELAAWNVPVLLVNCPEAEKLLENYNVLKVFVREPIKWEEMNNVLYELKSKSWKNDSLSKEKIFCWDNLGKRYIDTFRKI